jgi:nicotinamidase-related amidase
LRYRWPGSASHGSEEIMPSPYLLDRDRAVLCVIDIQERLAAAMAEREAVIDASCRLALSARRLGVPVVVTEQYPKGIGPTEPALIEALGDDYRPLEKLHFSCCEEPPFAARLRELGREQVVLCGMEMHVCLLATGLDLLNDGYQVHVVAEAVCSRNAEHKRLALEQVRQAGAVVTCVEAAVYQMLRLAGTPEFKDLLPLFR